MKLNVDKNVRILTYSLSCTPIYRRPSSPVDPSKYPWCWTSTFSSTDSLKIALDLGTDDVVDTGVDDWIDVGTDD